LAKPEVISQRIIFTQKNSTLNRTLTTPIKKSNLCFEIPLVEVFENIQQMQASNIQQAKKNVYS